MSSVQTDIQNGQALAPYAFYMCLPYFIRITFFCLDTSLYLILYCVQSNSQNWYSVQGKKVGKSGQNIMCEGVSQAKKFTDGSELLGLENSTQLSFVSYLFFRACEKLNSVAVFKLSPCF